MKAMAKGFGRYQRRRKINKRQLWANQRFLMETENMASKRYGGKSRHHWYALLGAIKIFEKLLRLSGLYERGYANAFDVRLRRLDLFPPNLPPAFDGFTILHLSDLHIDGMPDLENKVLGLIDGVRTDLCVLTGDYRLDLHGPFQGVLDAMKILVNGIESVHGVVGILGNHDGCHMVEPLEALGIRMLINERWCIKRGEDELQVIGTDDVHYYYSDQALHALEHARKAFTVGLIHSPELYDAAAELGVNLYLCGHTHGGQISLPTGIPLITHLRRGRRFVRGVWHHGGMLGVTHLGTGTSGIPIRFNTRGEVLLLTLRSVNAQKE